MRQLWLLWSDVLSELTPKRYRALELIADFIRERQGDGAATDLAGLESALTGSFMGQDAPPLTAAAFTTFDEVSLSSDLKSIHS